MNIFVTSDEHHGHGGKDGKSGIITLAKRPFTNVNEMTDAIIDRHNAKVRDASNPLTAHVGDMFWKTLSNDDVDSIMARMQGRHCYVFGNHEEVFERGTAASRHFLTLTMRDRFKHNKRLYILDHYAGRVWDKSHRGSVLLYGHSHGELPSLGLSFDIGVDVHNFEPWSLEELEARVATLKQHHIVPDDQLVEGTTLYEEAHARKD